MWEAKTGGVQNWRRWRKLRMIGERRYKYWGKQCLIYRNKSFIWTMRSADSRNSCRSKPAFYVKRIPKFIHCNRRFFRKIGKSKKERTSCVIEGLRWISRVYHLIPRRGSDRRDIWKRYSMCGSKRIRRYKSWNRNYKRQSGIISWSLHNRRRISNS